MDSLTATDSDKRVFLFLQGPSSSLFSKLASRLVASGHICLRVNLNAGDWLFWRNHRACNYRGSIDRWPSYISELLSKHFVTDLILLGEERPYHRMAIAIAKARDIDVTVIEMGYLRPDWVTVERDGMSSNSRFPDAPHVIRRAAAGLEDVDFTVRYRQSFLVEALFDLAYNLPNVFCWFLYPRYQRHAIFHPLVEYVGWLGRLLQSPRRNGEAEATIRRILKSERACFLYPLQLETDYQLRAHSPYLSQRDAIDEILTSFARHGPDAELIVKVHPLDNGLIDWDAVVRGKAKALGIGTRVSFLDGGTLSTVIEKSCGLVTVNSTTALHALHLGIPVKVLGSAIYDLAGMTHQGDLDSFWAAPERPNRDLTADFYRLLAATIQVKGNFYSRAGTAAAAEAIATRLINRTVNQPGGDNGWAPRTRPSKIRTSTYARK